MNITDVELKVQSYIAESGLGRLHLQDNSIAPNGVPSVHNENGILFLSFIRVQFFRALGIKSQGVSDIETIKSLQRLPEHKGLYNRQPGGNSVFERHDNYVGICALSVLYGVEDIPNAMLDWAWSNLWCFNNVEPRQFNKEQLRQGGELALYYVSAGKRAPLILWLWFLVGIFISGNKKQDAAKMRLTWLRLWLCDTKGVKGFLQRFLYRAVKSYWWKKAIETHGSESGLFLFGEDHPVSICQQIISQNAKY